ncbi:hypothetical protein DFR28_1021111 [Arenicella xantha]|uniref:Uncharacterized protein n=1 Tax=Arenicella xantha TaxID=644221 RepID=A0A395JM47_9GAMM|nr:hypothetical protein DFR28_1021111 [Arenicella xantha]
MGPMSVQTAKLCMCEILLFFVRTTVGFMAVCSPIDVSD